MEKFVGSSCSISLTEKKLEWFEISGGKIPTNFLNLSSTTVLLLRQRHSGFMGFNVMRMGQSILIVKDISYGRVETEVVNEGRSLIEATNEFMKNNPERGYNSRTGKMHEYIPQWDIAVREMTAFEKRVRTYVMLQNMEEVKGLPQDLKVHIEWSNSTHAPESIGIIPTEKWDGSRALLDGEYFPLTAKNQANITAEMQRVMHDNWQKIITDGGFATIITAKGMAKTQVPAGTLIDRTSERLLFPSGECWKKEYSGQGRGFSVRYAKTTNPVDLSNVNIFQYEIVEADHVVSETTRIFGCKNGDPQNLSA